MEAYLTAHGASRWSGLIFGAELKSAKAWSMFFGRLALGFLFLWSASQKILTELTGKMATEAFLAGPGVHSSPFALFFHGLAGNPIVEGLLVYGELAIGISLIFGVLTRVGSVAGALQILLFTLALWPIADRLGDNPLVDYRVIYGVLFLMFFFLRPGQFLGVDGIVSRSKLVKRFPRLNWLLG